MAFAPDLGIYLATKGAKPDTDLTFSGMLFPQLGTPDGSVFCATCNASFDGGEYALTVDMDRARLDGLIMSCPGNTAQMIVNALQNGAASHFVVRCSEQGWSMRMDEPVLVNVTGRLGEPQQSSRDTFIPLVASKIEPALAPVPLAAVAVLIALGREVAPFMESDDSVTREQLRSLRSRAVAVGEKVDVQGGIQLMRSAYSAAMRFLADEEIHVGRWIESVWDGIGQWQG